MKLALITSVFPYPLDEGGKSAQFLFLKEVSRHHHVSLICLVHDTFDFSLVSALNLEIPQLTIYIVAAKSTKRPSKVIWVRILERILWLARKRNWYSVQEITLLENLNFVDPVRPKSEDSFLELNRLITEICPDLVQIDFIENADLVLAIPRGIKKIIILHDLRSFSVAQFSESQKNQKAYSDYLFQLVFLKETISFKYFDGFVCFNDREASVLIHSGYLNVAVIPFSVPVINKKRALTISPIQKLVLLGPEHHIPNKDAVEWYVNEIYPILQDRIDLETWIIGKWEHSTIQLYKKYENIIFKGYMPSLEDSLSASILVVPLRMGSGLRTKILDAFSLHVPVVSTSIGIDGIPVKHKEHCMIADDSDKIVDSILTLIGDEMLIKNTTQNAYKLLNDTFSSTATSQKRIAFYQSIIDSA